MRANMFGLFNLSGIIIQTKIPLHALTKFHTIKSHADLHLADLPEAERDQAVAYVESVWCCNAATASDFHLSRFAYRLIQKMGMLSFQLLDVNFQNRAKGIVVELMRQGLISQKIGVPPNVVATAARVNVMPECLHTARRDRPNTTSQ